MTITILGLDIATSTGFCWLQTETKPSNWRCGVIEAEGDNGEDKAGDLVMALYAEIRQNRPDFAAIEMPLRNVTQFKRKKTDLAGEKPETTINPNALQLSTLAGGVVAMLDLCRIPWGLVAPVTWRKAYFGKGYKPPIDWKASAVAQAQLQQINLPPTKRAQRDAAEAAGIAHAWQRCTFISSRHQRAFMDLRSGRKVAA